MIGRAFQQVLPLPVGLRSEKRNPHYEAYLSWVDTEARSFFTYGDADSFLKQATLLFDEEEKRIASFDSRAQAILGATSVMVALLLAVVFSARDRLANLTDPWGIVITSLGAVAILYLTWTIISAIQVQEPRTRHTVGPSQVLPTRLYCKELNDRNINDIGTVGYTTRAAIEIVRITAKNYLLGHEKNLWLRSSQRSARNALIVLVAILGLVFVHDAAVDSTENDLRECTISTTEAPAVAEGGVLTLNCGP